MTEEIDEARKLRVDYITKNQRELEEQKHQFAVKHGFWTQRPENFKKCVVIRWKLRRKADDKNFIDYERIYQRTNLKEAICEKYDLDDEQDLFLDSDLKLIKIGIYSGYFWRNELWAIPDEFKEIQNYILSVLPKWVEVKRKI